MDSLRRCILCWDRPAAGRMVLTDGFSLDVAFRLQKATAKLPQFLQINGRLYRPFPASPCGRKNQTQHGPLAPETLLSFIATTGHSAILFAFGPLPVSTVIGPIFLQEFLLGAQDFSSFCRVPVAVSPPLPRRCGLPLRQVWDDPCCLRRL